MKVLFINRFCWPDRVGTGKVLTDLAKDLAQDGAEVAVVASAATIHEPGRRLERQEDQGGVRIHRVIAGRFDRRKVWGWFLNAILFYPVALWRVLRLPRHDATVFLTDPPLLFVLGPFVGWIKKTRFVCWSQDLYPDVAVELGVLGRRSPLTAFWRWLAGWALRRADLVIAIGEVMKERLVAKGVRTERIVVVHNWADGELARPVAPEANPFLERHGLKGKFVVMYSGNFGLSHEFDTVLEAAKGLRGQGGIAFVFIGEGKQFDKVRSGAAGMPARFLPFQPEEELSNSLSAASVHVVTLKVGLEGILVPSKLYGAMAVARPVIFVGGERSEVAQVLREATCGFTVAPGDVDGFVAAVLRLKAGTGERQAMGKRAHEEFLAKYERKIETARIAELLERVAKGEG
ncbi:MAG: glycosyltransferase family 4 protein [Candidatus Coatesbacteria bacterium]